MKQPEIAVLISSFERPAHLRRMLESLAVQTGVEGLMEVVVTDDGSRDETAAVVEQFARSAPFPVRMTTHPHAGFQLARCRNEGVAASTAPYILFLDGDCLLPPDHVRTHLDHRRTGVVQGGFCICLDRETSAGMTLERVRRGDFVHCGSWRERFKLLRLDFRSRLYNLLRHRDKPKLFGGNIAIWRRDFERINGYDESFVGWGCEDDDLRLRLRRAGLRIESILRWTRTYHLWHPKTSTAPRKWRFGGNVAYFHRAMRLTRCGNGLAKRTPADLHVAFASDPPTNVVRSLLPNWLNIHGPDEPSTAAPEVEILVLPGPGRFSRRANCRLAIVLDPAGEQQLRRLGADLVLAPRVPAGISPEICFALNELEPALRTLLERQPTLPLIAASSPSPELPRREPLARSA
jgi:glycosyltransferase involved in cell wall biosynthesis